MSTHITVINQNWFQYYKYFFHMFTILLASLDTFNDKEYIMSCCVRAFEWDVKKTVASSPLGQNCLFWRQRYQYRLEDIISLCFRNWNASIYIYVIIQPDLCLVYTARISHSALHMAYTWSLNLHNVLINFLENIMFP